MLLNICTLHVGKHELMLVILGVLPPMKKWASPHFLCQLGLLHKFSTEQL